MARQDHRGNPLPSRAGYFAAIIISALGHAALFALVFFIAPRYLHSEEAAPPAYTVKIVDSLPAGDLGTHLPRLAPRKAEQIAKADVPKPAEPAVEAPKPELAPDADKNAITLATTIAATPTPTPTPEAVAPTPEPSESQTPAATPHPTPKPAPAAKRSPRAAPSIVIARAEATPSVSQRLAKLRQQLLKEDLKRAKAKAAEEAAEGDDDDEPDEAPTPAAARPSGGGPVAANVASEGHGMGIGPGSGSAGIQQDLDFLLYYQQVQDKIKKAWTFTSGSSELTATVTFAIGPDGTLTGVKIAKGSNDAAFDDSVLRAIRRAAPFPAPPEKYRDQWAGGIEALFKLGELKS